LFDRVRLIEDSDDLGFAFCCSRVASLLAFGAELIGSNSFERRGKSDWSVAAGE
jgi:hypothetical protein